VQLENAKLATSSELTFSPPTSSFWICHDDHIGRLKLTSELNPQVASIGLVDLEQDATGLVDGISSLAYRANFWISLQDGSDSSVGVKKFKDNLLH